MLRFDGVSAARSTISKLLMNLVSNSVQLIFLKWNVDSEDSTHFSSSRKLKFESVRIKEVLQIFKNMNVAMESGICLDLVKYLLEVSEAFDSLEDNTPKGYVLVIVSVALSHTNIRNVTDSLNRKDSSKLK